MCFECEDVIITIQIRVTFAWNIKRGYFVLFLDILFVKFDCSSEWIVYLKFRELKDEISAKIVHNKDDSHEK